MVAKCAVLQQRYERREENGQYLFVLKARNGQEIARSRLFASAVEMEAALSWLVAEMPAYAEPYGRRSAAGRKQAAGYETLERLSRSSAAGFELVTDTVEKRHYFLFRADDGELLLFGQGYKSRASRDEAVRTLIKLGMNPARYEEVTEEGRYSFRIRAGNRQEI